MNNQHTPERLQELRELEEKCIQKRAQERAAEERKFMIARAVARVREFDTTPEGVAKAIKYDLSMMPKGYRIETQGLVEAGLRRSIFGPANAMPFLYVHEESGFSFPGNFLVVDDKILIKSKLPRKARSILVKAKERHDYFRKLENSRNA